MVTRLQGLAQHGTGDLGVEHRIGKGAGGMQQHLEILGRAVHDLGDFAVVQQPGQWLDVAPDEGVQQPNGLTIRNLHQTDIRVVGALPDKLRVQGQHGPFAPRLSRLGYLFGSAQPDRGICRSKCCPDLL